MSTDRIEKEIEISASVERVWEVLTEAEHVALWFGNGKPIEVDLRAGGEMTLDHGVHGTYRTVIVEVDPPRHSAYRWAAGFPDELATEDNSTLVEFDLVPTAAGTLLKVTESGF